MQNLFIAVPSILNNANPDKNGYQPVALHAIAGQHPSKNVIAGTIAANNSFSIGKRYLVSFTQLEDDAVHGVQFSFTNAGEISAIEAIELSKTLGAARTL